MVKHEEARKIISAAVEKAEEIGQPMNIAVMDAGMNLVAFERMDDAWVLSIDIAIDKAFTSAGRGLSTRDIGEKAQPGQPLFGVNTTNGGRVVIFPGGLPLMRDGEVVGAIGVSGGPVDQDEEVAEAGVAAFG
ncbi:heme-binding protein [soil metagenome]